MSNAEQAPTIALRERIWERAQSLGFDTMKVASAQTSLDEEHRRYESFIEAGKHGDMAYLERYSEARRRVDTPDILSGAKSVICLGKVYARPVDQERSDPPLAQGIARYARGRDYHNHLRKRLRSLSRFVASLSPGTTARAICDIEPVMERVWAARAGLGFIGKNGLVITPGRGSYQLLGEVITTLELPRDEPIAERCGSCTRCLDACPTQAFDAPFVLDPTKCISYLTIERRAPVSETFVEPAGEHLFGCDDCQDVCPFNQTGGARSSEAQAYEPLPQWQTTSLLDLVQVDDEAHRALTEGSPLRRAGRAALAGRAVQIAAARLAGGKPPEPPTLALVIAEGLRHDSAEVRAAAEAAFERLPAGPRALVELNKDGQRSSDEGT